MAILIIVGNLAILCVGSYYEITDYRHEVGGLESFEDLFFGYLPKLPSSSSTTSKRAQEKSAQKEMEKEGGSLSRNSSSLTQVEKGQEMDKSSNEKVVSAEPQRTKTEDRFEEELKWNREEGLDEAIISQEGFLKYLEYVSMEKEALRRECHEKSRNLDGRLSRVKKRFIKIYKAETEREHHQQIEMTENPLRRSADSDLSRI